MKPTFKITYFLWKARADKAGLAPVYLRSAQNSTKQISFNTGVKMHPLQWHKKRNEPKNKPAKLLELEAKLQATYRDLADQGHEPNLQMLIERMNDRRKPTGKNIIEWCQDYQLHPYSEGQKKSVRTLRSNILEFNPGLRFDQLRKPHIKLFFDWLTARGVANNSQFKRLRALANVGEHANLHLPDLSAYRLPYEAKNALKVRLNWPEVKSVMNAETKTEVERVAKDVFLIACFTGLRISDILSLNAGELHEYHYEKLQIKTKLPVLITLHAVNADLMARYHKSGVPYTRQTLSRALKAVLQRAGLEKEVTRVQAVGAGFREIKTPKYQEISFHSGRRFYARLLNDLGLGNEIAREELGHSFRSVTELYSGSPDHLQRVARVRKAISGMDKTLEELALMKVA